MNRLVVAASFSLFLTGGMAVADTNDAPALLGSIDSAEVEPMSDPAMRGEKFYFYRPSSMSEAYAVYRANQFCEGKRQCRLSSIPGTVIGGNSSYNAYIKVSYKVKKLSRLYTRYANF